MDPERITWLNWDFLMTPFEFRFDQAEGPLSGLTCRLVRDGRQQLQVKVLSEDAGVFLALDDRKGLKLGQQIPYPRDRKGTARYCANVTIEGLRVHRSRKKSHSRVITTGQADRASLEFMGTAAEPTEYAVDFFVNAPRLLPPVMYPRKTSHHWLETYTRRRKVADLDDPMRLMTYEELVVPVSDGSLSSMNSNHLRISWNDATLLYGTVSKSKALEAWKPGFLETRDPALCASADERAFALAAIGFAIGSWGVQISNTQFSKGPRLKAVSAVGHDAAITRRLLSRPNMPPAPLQMDDAYFGTLDEGRLNSVVGGLKNAFTRADFMALSWLITLAAAAPLELAVVQWTAVLEWLRRHHSEGGGGTTKLVASERFSELQAHIDAWLRAYAEADPQGYSADASGWSSIRSRIGSLNGRTSGQQFPDFFNALDLQIGAVETAALRARNLPAHGSAFGSRDLHWLVHQRQALQTLVNRVVLRKCGCTAYVDYSTLGFPVREIVEPLGGENGDGRPTARAP